VTGGNYGSLVLAKVELPSPQAAASSTEFRGSIGRGRGRRRERACCGTGGDDRWRRQRQHGRRGSPWVRPQEERGYHCVSSARQVRARTSSNVAQGSTGARSWSARPASPPRNPRSTYRSRTGLGAAEDAGGLEAEHSTQTRTPPPALAPHETTGPEAVGSRPAPDSRTSLAGVENRAAPSGSRGAT